MSWTSNWQTLFIEKRSQALMFEYSLPSRYSTKNTFHPEIEFIFTYMYVHVLFNSLMVLFDAMIRRVSNFKFLIINL